MCAPTHKYEPTFPTVIIPPSATGSSVVFSEGPARAQELMCTVHPLQVARCAWYFSKWDGLKKWFWLFRQKHWRRDWWRARPWK